MKTKITPITQANMMAGLSSRSFGRGKAIYTTPKTTSRVIPQAWITSIKKAPSIQPSVPKIATSSITTRAISAPVAPTALGRTSNIVSAAPLGGGAIPTPSPGVGGGLSGSISNLGSSITNTIKEYIPLAIKIILAIIVIKILLWLLKGRR